MPSAPDHTGEAPLTLRAPAKVNLFLEVPHRRPDGFHAVATMMVAIDLADTLSFMTAPTLTLTCTDPALSTGADNLVMKAADRLRAFSGRSDGAHIHLTKNIPAAAGLAGGSSDAAATLVGLSRLWNLNLDPETLAALAADLGSDVAFFLAPSAAWCTGRGEIVEPVRLGRTLHFVLVCPAEGLSTAAVYRALTPPAQPRDGGAMRRAVASGDVVAIGRELFNRLQTPAETLMPRLGEWRQTLGAEAPLGCLMSGSGSTLFALCADRADASALAGRLRGRLQGEPPPRVFVVQSEA